MSNDPLKVWWSRIWSSELPLASLFRNLAWNQTHLLFASYESPAVATTTYRSSVLLKASLPVVFLQECLYEEKTPSNRRAEVERGHVKNDQDVFGCSTRDGAVSTPYIGEHSN